MKSAGTVNLSLGERSLTRPQYAAAKTALETDLADAAGIAVIDEVMLTAIDLLESHPLRASDAIQISSGCFGTPVCSPLQTRANVLPQRLPA